MAKKRSKPDRKSDRRSDRKPDRGGRGGRSVPKVCPFCKDGTEWVDYKDAQLLRKFLSDRGKIRSRRATGACVQHQRDLATAIKNAREVALLPYMNR